MRDSCVLKWSMGKYCTHTSTTERISPVIVSLVLPAAEDESYEEWRRASLSSTRRLRRPGRPSGKLSSSMGVDCLRQQSRLHRCPCE